MTIETLALTLSFLDIGDFQDCFTMVPLFDLLELSVPEQTMVFLVWMNNTQFTVHHEHGETWLKRNSRDFWMQNWKRSGKPSETFLKKRILETQRWFSNGELRGWNVPKYQGPQYKLIRLTS